MSRSTVLSVVDEIPDHIYKGNKANNRSRTYTEMWSAITSNAGKWCEFEIPLDHRDSRADMTSYVKRIRVRMRQKIIETGFAGKCRSSVYASYESNSLFICLSPIQ